VAFDQSAQVPPPGTAIARQRSLSCAARRIRKSGRPNDTAAAPAANDCLMISSLLSHHRRPANFGCVSHRCKIFDLPKMGDGSCLGRSLDGFPPPVVGHPEHEPPQGRLAVSAEQCRQMANRAWGRRCQLALAFNAHLLDLRKGPGRHGRRRLPDRHDNGAACLPAPLLRRCSLLGCLRDSGRGPRAS
jgi:hypothetical protein